MGDSLTAAANGLMSTLPRVPTMQSVDGLLSTGADSIYSPASFSNLWGAARPNTPAGFGMPTTGGVAGGLGATGLGFNLPTIQDGVGTLTSLGNLWTGLKAVDLAKNQLDFVRSTTNANLNNQMKLINTRIEDRARARGAMEGQSAEQVQGYIDRNRLTR